MKVFVLLGVIGGSYLLLLFWRSLSFSDNQISILSRMVIGQDKSLDKFSPSLLRILHQLDKLTYSVVLILLFVRIETSGDPPLVEQTKWPKFRHIPFQSDRLIRVKIGKRGIPFPMSLARAGVQAATALQFFLISIGSSA